MKTKVRATWLIKELTQPAYDSLEQLMKSNKYIGFQPSTAPQLRYMIVQNGPDQIKGTAIRFNGRWTNLVNQKTTKGDYYIFDTAAELYEWMKG